MPDDFDAIEEELKRRDRMRKKVPGAQGLAKTDLPEEPAAEPSETLYEKFKRIVTGKDKKKGTAGDQAAALRERQKKESE